MEPAMDITKTNPLRNMVDHINVSIYSNNEHARQLTDIALNEFSHSLYGSFKCMRGMIYWLSYEKPPERTRERYGTGFDKSFCNKKNKKVKRRLTYQEIVTILIKNNLRFRIALLTLLEKDLPFVAYHYTSAFFSEHKYLAPLISVYNELRNKPEVLNAILREIN